MSWFSLDRRGLIALLLVVFVAALLYLATLDNGVSTGNLQGGDLITHQYAQVQARPSNAPGYPIYTMGGWLWFHGLKSLAPDINSTALLSSYSTLWGLLALGFLFFLNYKLTDGNLVISIGLSAFYAVTYFFWFYSVTTEQYTSAVLQTLAIVALTLAWDYDPRDRYLYAIAFLLGLALAHLITVLFVAPGAILFVLSKQPKLLKRWRLILGSIVAALVPLLSYTFVYIRGAQHPEWRGEGNWPNPTAWFLDFISTQQGRDELTWTLGPFTDQFPSLIWGEMTIILLVLGLVGWYLMGRRYLLMFGLTALFYLGFSYIDRHGNWFQVIMPLYPLVLLGAAVSLDRLWRTYLNRIWRAALVLILLGLIIPKFLDSYPRANQHNRPDDTGLQPGQVILDALPPANAAILVGADEKLALDYLTIIWGVRPDIQTMTSKQAAKVLAAGEELFVTSIAAAYASEEIGQPLRYSSWEPGLLQAKADGMPDGHRDDLVIRNEVLGDGMRLRGFSFIPGPEPGQWDVKIALSADSTPTQDWATSVRLLRKGEELTQFDHPAPAEGHTPTTILRPGDIVLDAFRLETTPDTQPDGIRLILYRRLSDGSFENLADVKLER